MVLLALSASPVTMPFCTFCAGDISGHGVSLAHKTAESFRVINHNVLAAVQVDGGSELIFLAAVPQGPSAGHRPGVPIRHPVLRI